MSAAELLDVLDSESDEDAVDGASEDDDLSGDAVDDIGEDETDDDEDSGSVAETRPPKSHAKVAKAVKPRSGLDEYDAAIRAAKRKLGIRHGSELKKELAEDGLDGTAQIYAGSAVLSC